MEDILYGVINRKKHFKLLKEIGMSIVSQLCLIIYWSLVSINFTILSNIHNTSVFEDVVVGSLDILSLLCAVILLLALFGK